MRLLKLFALNTLLLAGGATMAVAAATPVTTSGRTLLVAGKAFTVQGVNYSPTPVGQTLGLPGNGCLGPYAWWTDRPSYIADFPLIAKMGANTIRTFNLMNSGATQAQVIQALDAARANGLYVIMGYSIPVFNSFTSSTATVRSEVLAAVNAYKDHPAVLMWAIGNEVNLAQPEGYDPTWSSSQWYGFLDSLAQEVKALDPNHPVSSMEGEIPNVWGLNIGNAAVNAADVNMTHLDIWGANAYRGTGFGTLFSTLAAATAKPILISEFGKDAYRDSKSTEDQDMQASYISAQWQAISADLAANDTGNRELIGGAVFEWTDEWWKVNSNSCFTHDNNVLFTRSTDSVDPNYQDEWFGIVGVSPVDAVSNPAGTARTLRKAYTALQGFWNPTGAASTNASTSLFAGTVRNYPNPFQLGSGTTKFVALLNQAATVTVQIYDAGGQFVTSLTRSATGPGRLEIVWDGRSGSGSYVNSGLYFARIEGSGGGKEEKQFRRVVAVK